ncbi:MAG TPA: COX15/CtaA family protein [Acidimicrobiales bacterium]
MRLPRLSPPAYRRLALATLVALVLVSVVGAGVRLTGSGLGCSTWPACESDSFTPRSASDGHAMIEFVNRLINAAVGLLAIAAVVGARRRRPRRADLVRWSQAVLGWVLANGLVGAVVVWLHLSPVSVIAHFVLALGAIWSALVLHRRAGEDDGAGERRRLAATAPFVNATRALVAAAGAVLLTGTVVTGSGPHAGDERADRLALEIGTVVRVHGVSMLVFLALTVAVVRMAHRGDAGPTVVQRSHELLVVLVAQAAVGYWQYFTGVPALLVAFHVLGALLVWVAVLRLSLSLRTATAAERPGATAPAASPVAAGAAHPAATS